ncbi:MAG: YgjP-like metallopeptidase domain-containing protein [Planctomycetota bacterium]
MATPIPYLAGYPPELQEKAAVWLAEGRILPALQQRYPERHGVHNHDQLRRYVLEIKDRYLRKTPPLKRVLYDDKLHVVHQALGLNTQRSHAHGGKLRTQHEIRVGRLFQTAPEAFLRMIVVHELAHLKHFEHDQDFYRLCCHMEPDYHQLEFDLRLYLAATEAESGA